MKRILHDGISEHQRRKMEQAYKERKMDTYEKLEDDYKRIKAENLAQEIQKFVRPEVWKFALLMEQQLKANDHKAGWKDAKPEDLLKSLGIKAQGLEIAVLHSAVFDPEQVVRKAADVANFAMMVGGCVWGFESGRAR